MFQPNNKWIGLSVVLAVIFTLYLPALDAPFLSMDDPAHITENEAVRSLSLSNIGQIFTSTVNNTYVPLTSLSFAVEYFCFKDRPFYYHLNNVFGHLAVIALLFLLGTRLGLSTRASLLAALLFGIHPMHVESVAWVSARKDLLYSIFYLSSIHFYLIYTDPPASFSPIKLKKKHAYAASLFFALLGILAKPMALSLPLILGLLDWFRKRPLNKSAFTDKLPFFLFIIPLSAITFVLNTRHYHFVLSEALPVFSWTFTFNLKKFFLPAVLSNFYTLPLPVNWLSPPYFTSLTLTAVLAVLLFSFRRNRLLAFSLLYYFFSIFFLLMYHVGDDVIMPVADRFMYLPSAGLCLWLGTLADKALLATRGKSRILFSVLASGLALVVGLLSIKTFSQCRLYRDEILLWTNSIHCSPAAFYAYRNRAAAYQKQNRVPEALADYNTGIELKPDFAQAYFNRGTLFRKIHQFDAALADYSKAISLEADYPDPYNNRGVIYSYQKRYAEALADFQNFVRLKPNSVEGHFNRGKAYLLTENYKAALRDFDFFIRKRPDEESGYYLRGLVFINLARMDLAAADFRRTLKINPHHPIAQTRLDAIMQIIP